MYIIMNIIINKLQNHPQKHHHSMPPTSKKFGFGTCMTVPFSRFSSLTFPTLAL